MTHYRILLAGDTGTGKTSQFMTFPGKRYAMLFDPGAASTLDLSQIDHAWWLPKAGDLAILPRRDVKKRKPKLYTEWATDFNVKLQHGFFEGYDGILVDSLTLLGQACLNEELARDPEDERIAYRLAGETMVQAIWALCSLPCHVLLTVHTKFSEDKDTAKMEHKLTVPGGSKLFMPRFVSAMWFTLHVEGKQGPEYKVLTRPQAKWPHVRTPRAWAHLPLYHDVTIDWRNPLDCGIGKLLKETERNDLADQRQPGADDQSRQLRKRPH